MSVNVNTKLFIKTTVFVFACASVVFLTGCQGLKQQLGVGRNSPDEFTVVKRAPLTLPPEYGLRPPSDSYLQSSSTVPEKAKTILLGTQNNDAVAGNAEQILMGKMGVDAAQPDIRKTIEKDNGYLALENQSVANKLMFWTGSDATVEDVPQSVIDAHAEAERLKKNDAEGAPANTGDVPVIEKKKGTIDRFF